MIINKNFPILGMHCASCKVLIERTLNSTEGVQKAQVNYGTEKLFIEYDTKKITLEKIKKIVKSLGTYELVTDFKGNTSLSSPANAKNIVKEKKQKELKKLKNKLIIVSFLSIPFTILMFYMIFGSMLNLTPLSTFIDKDYLHYMQFLLSTIVIFYGAREIYSSALVALKIKSFNMDTLIMFGTFTAWFYSSIVTFFPNLLDIQNPEVYFEAAVFIILFILLGRYLEFRAKNRTNDAISQLVNLQVKEAIVLKNGKEVLTPLEQVFVNDILVVKPGTKIPVDGVIIKGSTTIDESMITGESIPVEKSLDSNVIGSTINKSGNIQIKALKVGSDTMLAQIIKMVEDAQSSQAPIQKLADKVSSYFVPSVLIISLFTFIFWLFVQSLPFAVYAATSVIIIACPCALGLATPTAIMVSTGSSAKKGILIKNAKSLELANKITHVVFDKTGTLTKGQPKVTSFEYLENKVVSEKDLKNIIYSIESKSHHPLSEAITSHFIGSKELEVSNFRDIPGLGIQAEINNKKVLIGNEKILHKNKINLTNDLQNKSAELQNNAETVSFVIIDKILVSIIGVSDPVKKESKSVVDELNKMGIKTYMLTGDSLNTASAIAKKVGIKNVIAQVLPNEKTQKIIDLQKESKNNVVAMVGDGINDAPSLVQADIGIAMGTGTDIAIESGDIILVGGSINKIPEAIKISKNTVSTIKQNLFWAFGYNSLGIPLAAGVLYPIFQVLLSPIFASFAMAMSSVSVLANSLRLKSKNNF